MDTRELMAKAMYDDWKSRERVVRDEWEDVAYNMRRVFMIKADAAYNALLDAGLVNVN